MPGKYGQASKSVPSGRIVKFKPGGIGKRASDSSPIKQDAV
jgi:hypothetical protein